MGWFRSFVEAGTDAKYVPLGTKCAVCGKKLGFFYTGFWSVNTKQYEDGAVCSRCTESANRLLKNYRVWKKKGYLCKDVKASKSSFGNVGEMKTLTEAVKNSANETLNAYDGRYSALFWTESSCNIAPANLQVGIKRAKRLKDVAVLYGYVQQGVFQKDCKVAIRLNDRIIHTTILEAYVFSCKENTLETELKAHMGKQRIGQGCEGWIVLNTTEEIPPDAIVMG